MTLSRVGDARLVEHRVEARLGQVLEAVGACGRRSSDLRRQHDERALLGDQRLPAEQVEVLRGGRAVRDADVALGRQLRGSARAGRRSAPARPLVAVREQQRQPRGLAPLRQAARDELVDDHLGAVGEVAELRLPEHQRLGRLAASSRTRSPGRRPPTGGCCAARSAPWRSAGAGSARKVWPFLASWRTRWRWLNVPRSASWPVRRIGTPSASSEANASASAWAQSMPPSAPTASRRRSSCLTQLRWTVKPSGDREQLLVEADAASSVGTAVSTVGLGVRSSWYSPVGCSIGSRAPAPP